MGATWDPDLIGRMATVIAREARALGIHIAFSPMLGLGRDARWGRIEETYGEDPHLVGRMGCAFIRGLQGMDENRFDREHIIAVPKHFVADGEPSRGINGAPVDISMEALRETHMKPFEDVVKQARAGGIMPAHHSLNRVPCHANRWLLHNVLIEEWGFDGIIVSDCLDIPKLWAFGEEGYTEQHNQHRVARDVIEAGVLALRAGIAMELGGDWEGRSYGKKRLEAIQRGDYPDGEAIVDQAVHTILLTKMRLGLFDDWCPVAPEDDPEGKAGSSGIVDGREEYAQRVAAREMPAEPVESGSDLLAVLTLPEHEDLARVSEEDRRSSPNTLTQRALCARVA